jgi:mannitol-1-phosphate 5-dehydrogenase
VPRTVVQFGAGSIGRGFMGQIFTEAGYEVVFVDVAPQLVAALDERRSYPLRLVGPDRFETLTIRPVRAVDGRDAEAVAQEIAACEFACTAVGVGVLPRLSPTLAKGIRARGRVLDVILCENQLHCSELLRTSLREHLTDEEVAGVGLVESVVSRMVPVVPDDALREDPLIAVAEDYPRLPVDPLGFEGEPPPVPALELVEDFFAYFERKLYVHNLGHAVAAYLGYLAGSQHIHDALAVPQIEEMVGGAMEESSLALTRKHGMDPGELARHRADLLRRFRNAALGDTVLRVGRDPVRKLRAGDRLVGAAQNCLDWDVEPERIAWGIAAALHFDPPDDPGAGAVQQVVGVEGVETAFERFTGQGPDGELGERVLPAWHRLAACRGAKE